jgi:hypothetical protein
MASRTVIPRGVRMTFFKRIQRGCRLRSTYFFAVAKKSKQKKPLEGSTGFYMKHGFAQLNNSTWMLGLGTNHQGSVFDYLKVSLF